MPRIAAAPRESSGLPIANAAFMAGLHETQAGQLKLVRRELADKQKQIDAARSDQRKLERDVESMNDDVHDAMAQVPPCPRLRVACSPRAPRRFAAALDAGAYGACACPLVGGRGAGRSGDQANSYKAPTQSGSQGGRAEFARPGRGAVAQISRDRGGAVPQISSTGAARAGR